MEEYGGYLEFEHFKVKKYHNGIPLNCGRNCLRYLIRIKKIKYILLPYFICKAVIEACKMEKVDVEFYFIGYNFLPQNIELRREEQFLYVVNYYGLVNSEYFKKLVERGNVIIDNSQAFFVAPLDGSDTIYTCRKFFGVTDGGYLVTNSINRLELEIDKSSQYVGYLFGRYEEAAEDFYLDFRYNESRIDKSEIKSMSMVTQNLLSIIDYEIVKQRRSKNFYQFHQFFRDINQIEIPENGVEGAYMYPLLMKNSGKLRDRLIKRKIFVPTLWTNVMENMPEDTVEYIFAENILPLPCDQRYDAKDIKYICDIIKGLLD